MSINKDITPEQAISALRSLTILHSGDLDKVFAYNGQKGYKATGRFALLAKATGITRSFVGKIIKGEATPSMDTMKKIAEVCNVSTMEVFRFISDKQSSRVI